MSPDQMTELYRLARKGKAAERRRGFIERTITGFLVRLLIAFLDGWLLMLGVGFLHATWWAALPTMGYWTAVLAVIILRGVFSRVVIPPAKDKA